MFVQILPGNVQAHTGAGRIAFHVILTFLVAGSLPGAHTTFPKSLPFVRNDQVVVNAHDSPEAAAMFAGTKRRVEGKSAGLGSAVFNVALRAMQPCTETPDGCIATLVIQGMDGDVAVTLLQGGVQRLHDTLQI